MECCYWCSTCSGMYEKDQTSEHADHDVKHVGGEDVRETLKALDEIIEFGMKTLKSREEEVATANEVKDDIEEIRQKCVDNSRARIERIVKDVRVAMEDSTAQLLGELNTKVGDMEMKCHSVINTSRVKFESIKGFIKEAALTLPDEESGRLDSRQLGKLYAFYKTVEKMEKQPRASMKYVDLNIRYPDSYERKKECKALAQSISGRIESSPHNSLTHMDSFTDEVEDTPMPLYKPKRRESRDMLVN